MNILLTLLPVTLVVAQHIILSFKDPQPCVDMRDL